LFIAIVYLSCMHFTSAVNPFIPLVILLLAIATVHFSRFILPLKLSSVKYTSIDGLRGYLALFVFIHHGAVWYYYIAENRWDNPPSNLFTHFGQTSVLLFFMVTGFLFYSKLIGSFKKSIDWTRFYVSRFLRLTPLYYLLLIFVVMTIFMITGFKFLESPVSFLKNILSWMTFGITGMPDLNKVIDSKFIIAWVAWSLVYEWLFYFSLPLIGLVFFRIRCDWKIILLSLTGFIFVIYNIEGGYENIISFSGGIAAAFIYRYEKFKEMAVTRISSLIALICLINAVAFYDSAYHVVPMTLISVFFIIVANGNSLFGILHLDVSRALGQISYTIYLFHGLFLFLTFTFIAPGGHAPLQHWIYVSAITIPLIFICRIIYHFYEAPLFQSTTKVAGFFSKKDK